MSNYVDIFINLYIYIGHEVQVLILAYNMLHYIVTVRMYCIAEQWNEL